MAGLTSGTSLALASFVPAITGDITHSVSRTRRCLGAFQLGAVLAGVFASRRRDDVSGVSLALGEEAGAVTARMTPAQARMLARSLIEAAAAVEQSLRQVQFTRGGACHG